MLFVLVVASTLSVGAQQWERVEAQGEVIPRVANGFMSCKGFFYLIGGYGLPATNVFDPSYNSWFKAAPPPVEMHHFQAVRHEETIIVAGAFTGQGALMKPLEHIWFYHTDRNLWEKGPAMPQGRARGSAAAQVHKGQLYIVGGNTGAGNSPSVPWVDRLDLRKLTWKRLPDAPRAREHFHSAVINGQLYVAGGQQKSDLHEGEKTLGKVDVLRLERNKWSTLPEDLSLPTRRMGTAVVAVLDHFLVIGGRMEGSPEACNKVEAFDVENQRWVDWGPLNEGRFETQAFMCVGAVWVASLTFDGEKSPVISMETLSFD